MKDCFINTIMDQLSFDFEPTPDTFINSVISDLKNESCYITLYSLETEKYAAKDILSLWAYYFLSRKKTKYIVCADYFYQFVTNLYDVSSTIPTINKRYTDAFVFGPLDK